MNIEIPVLDKGSIRYIDQLGTDDRILEAARVSYRSTSKGEEKDKKLLKYLWNHHHTSPFEQCSITYYIKLPIFIQAQLVRHRTQRLNQVSARYTEMKEEFYLPDKWRAQDTKNKQGSLENSEIDSEGLSFGLKTHCEKAYSHYEFLLSKGIAKEMARMVLPQNLYTEIYSNWDLSNLMKMFRFRLDHHAQWEIQQYARAMFTIFDERFPWCGEAFRDQNPELFV